MSRLVCVFMVVAACGGKGPVDEDFSNLATVDQKSDAFSYRMKVLGPLSGSDTTLYTSAPRFRAWTLPGGHADAWVRSTQGDAVAWLLDARFKVVAKNDDADDTTYDAHVVGDLAGSGYLVFRDYDLQSHYFTATLAASDTSCTGTGQIASVPDACMDDGGGTGIDDSLEIYCVHGITRFCLSGEACPWRADPDFDDGTTCSRAGLDTGGELFMAHATCNQFRGHEWYVCSDDAQISFAAPQ